MGSFPNLHITAMTIFFGTNLLVCITANSVNTIPPGIGTEPQTITVTLPKDASDIDPLSKNLFTVEVSDFLSPDMFSQANPFDYFLKKTTKLPIYTIRNLNREVLYDYQNRKFPQRYVPYAKLAWSLLYCRGYLEETIAGIRIIQRYAEKNHPFTLPEVFTLDPVISPLFSLYVFSDKQPPVRLLRKLVEIPEEEISSLRIRVQKLMNHRHFPRRYSLFAQSLLAFLNHHSFLTDLKTSMDEMQSVVASSTTHGVHDLSNLQIDDEVEPQTDDLDSSAQRINKPNNGSTSMQPSQEIFAIVSNNDSNANTPLREYINDNIRIFLSSDIFSQPDPFSYLLAKAITSRDILQRTDFYLTYALDHDEVPQRYVPYAELLSSLLLCVISLRDMDTIIYEIQLHGERYHHSFRRKAISKLDPESLKLFADDIFFKPNPLSSVLIALLDIPDNEISNVVSRLQNFVKNKHLPARYSRYVKCILNFLDKDYLLLRLKDNIAETQRMLMPYSSSTEQSNSKIIQE